jgi:predicted AlkP superfamily pyrophosphatase or phosphodiesterase
MKLALATLTGVGLCGVGSAQTPPQQRMVIVISLGGFPAYALDDAKLPVPTLRRLIRQGVTARMGIINPTVTWPNHTTMVTGVRADEHGLLDER